MVYLFCAVCGSYGGRVVRRSLPSERFGAPTAGRRPALHFVLLDFLPGSKRTARVDCVLGEVLRAQSGPCRTKGPLLSHVPFATSFLYSCNMWCFLLEGVYHERQHRERHGHVHLHRSKATSSQSCHFAFFGNPVACASTDRFCTFCDEHLVQEHDSQAECLRRKHE